MKIFKFAFEGQTHIVYANTWVEATVEMDEIVVIQGPWSWRLDENGIYRVSYD